MRGVFHTRFHQTQHLLRSSSVWSQASGPGPSRQQQSGVFWSAWKMFSHIFAVWIVRHQRILKIPAWVAYWIPSCVIWFTMKISKWKGKKILMEKYFCYLKIILHKFLFLEFIHSFYSQTFTKEKTILWTYGTCLCFGCKNVWYFADFISLWVTV